MKPLILALAAPLLLGQPVQAQQQIDLSIIRVAGAICGSGLSAEVQGDLNARIARLFGGVEASGDTSVDLGQAADLLDSFKEGDRTAAYQTYVSCVIQTVNAVTGVSGGGDQPNVVFDSIVVPDALAKMDSGDIFAMKLNETRAIGDMQTVFSLLQAKTGNTGPHIYFSWSDAGSGKSQFNTYAYQAQSVTFPNGCTITPFKIDFENETASFSTFCK